MILGICLAISLFFITVVQRPIAEQKVIERIRYYTQSMLDKKLPYVWGGSWIFGADCSGSIALILKLSGVGGYPRMSSLKMWLVWPHKKKVTKNAEIWKEGKFPNLVFFTYPSEGSPRPFGHTSWRWKNGKVVTEFMIAEASYGQGYFKETMIKKGDYRDKHIVGLMVLNLTPGL